MMKRVGLLACVCALVLAGCGGSGSKASLPDPGIKLVNLSPDSSTLDLYIDNDLKAKQIPLGSVSTNATITQGERDVLLQDSTAGTQLDAFTATFGGNSAFAIVAVGLQNYGTEYIKRLRLLPVQVTTDSLPGGNKARLIILNAYLRGTGLETPAIDFQSPGDNPLFSKSGVNFGSTQSLDVDSGLQTFQARRGGSENVYAQQTITLTAGKVYLAAVTGTEGGSGAQAPTIKFLQLN